MNSEKKSALLFVLIIGFVMLVAVIGCSKQAVSQGLEEKLAIANKYLMEQKYEEAILAFQEVIKIDPKNIKARIGLAQAYVVTEKYDKAEASLKEVIAIDEKSVQGYTDLIKLYEKMKKDNKEIISLIQTAIEKTGEQAWKQWLEEYSSNESKIITDDVLINIEEVKQEYQNQYQDHKITNWQTGMSYLDTKTGVFYIVNVYSPEALKQPDYDGWRLSEKDIWKQVIVKKQNVVVYDDKAQILENILNPKESDDIVKMFENYGKLVFIDHTWFGIISGDLPLEEHLNRAGISSDSYVILN